MHLASRVGGSDDPFERQARRVADAIAGPAPRAASQPRAAASASQSPPATVGDLGAGLPLPPGLRSELEPRFGHSFDAVRIHTSTAATRAARALNARAFTHGTDIAFADGEFAPHTNSGRHLLAHELTHVVQQSGRDAVEGSAPPAIQREEFQPAPGQLGRETGRVTTGGRTDVTLQRTVACGNIYTLHLVFDRNTCTITLPTAVRFVHPAQANQRLPRREFNALADRFVAVANQRLNGWYAIDIGAGASGCSAPCQGRVPIEVSVTRSNAASAYPITLLNSSGRSWMTPRRGTIYGGDVSEWTLWHEAGHAMLGISDEYEDEDRACRQGSNVDESSFSVMASSSAYGARALMHPRHFSHVLQWAQTEFPACAVTLPALERPLVVDTVIGVESGGGTLGGQGAAYVGAFALHGFPTDRARRVRLLFGARFSMLTSGERLALLGGLTVGADASTNRSAGGFGAGIDATIAAGVIGRTGELANSPAAVFELGANLGYSGPQFEFGLTGRAGLPLNEAQRENAYYILGLRLAGSF